MAIKAREILQEKIAKLLDHLYFQETKSTINVMIIFIFFVQKLNLMMLFIQNESLKEQELYFNVCWSALSWVTFQNPLKVLNSEGVNLIVTLLYTTLHLVMFFVFCFSLYKWQFIQKIFTIYISLFQLLVLYHTQIHILSQEYSDMLNILLTMPLYINYSIIAYCSRNYFILSQNILRRYSIFNYFIILIDYITFILYKIVSSNIRQYLILILFLVYFCDSFFFKPYSSKINIAYLLATSFLTVAQLAKISMLNFQVCYQIYAALIFAPLVSILTIQIQQKYQQLSTQSSNSLEAIINQGEILNNSQPSWIEGTWHNKTTTTLQQSSQLILHKLKIYQHNLSLSKNVQYESQMYTHQKEEVQLYILFLNHSIKGSNLQCLLQAKKFQLENNKHSLFFKVITDLISQKYDEQVQIFGKTEALLTQNNHEKITLAREFQLFYINNIDKVCDVIDEKIRIWNKILSGFKNIDDALNSVVKLHKSITQLSKKHNLVRKQNNHEQSYDSIKNFNVLDLRYLSFFYSYIENNLLTSLKIEKKIEQLMNLERDKISIQSINSAILKNEIAIVSASILENKGAITNSDAKELNMFFGLEQSNQKIGYINQLMPKFIEENHDNYIAEFISKGVSDLYNKSKSVFGIDGEGYILTVELSFLHINEKSQDFILTAVLQKNYQRNKEMVLFGENGKILGISKKIYQQIFRGSKNFQQQIDTKLYDYFIQFWIPQVIPFLQNQEKKVQHYKQMMDIFILDEIQFDQEKFLRENTSQDGEQLAQSIQQFYLNHYTKAQPQKIQIEVEFQYFYLPNDQIFYGLQFSNLGNEILSINSQENFLNLGSSTNQKFETDKKYIEGEDILQTKKATEFQQLHLLRESSQQFKLENLESQFLNSQNQQDPLKEADMSFQTKKKIFNYQAQSQQSSQQSTNSNMHVYEVIKQIVRDDSQHKYVFQIFLASIILLMTIVLLQSAILKIFHDQNQFLQDNVQLVKYPDQYNRLYCSFTTMGQLDVERSILGTNLGQYASYRIKELSKDLQEQMKDMLPSLRIQFSNLEVQNRLPLLNIRIIGYFDYHEEIMRMMQFNFLVESETNDLNQKILSSYQYIGENKAKVLDLYFEVQFLKGNLKNQIQSSQSLIDGIIDEINGSNSQFSNTMNIFLIIMLILICFHTLLITYIWRKSYQSIKLMIQLITSSQDVYIYNSIDRAKYGKQLIKGHTWKQINYFSTNFNPNQYRSNNTEEFYLIQLKNKNKSVINVRIHHQQFQLKITYIKIFILMLLILCGCLFNYIYLTETSTSSLPEMNLTLEYVQFKQNWDSLMILSYLLKTNTFTASKALELGFLDKNEYLKNSSLYFHNLYAEFLEIFSTTVPKVQEYNPYIFSGIENSERMLEQDKQKLYNLYQNDLCIELLEELPFCSFFENKFTYFPDYPTPLEQNNNREIFRAGINGLVEKILQMFQSSYHLELLNTFDTDISEIKIFTSSSDFKLYILQYNFDINKAVVTFYQTVLSSFTNLLEQDYKNILLFNILTLAFILKIYLFFLLYFLQRLGFLIRASKSSLTLLPQECLAESKCQMLIKKYKNEN